MGLTTTWSYGGIYLIEVPSSEVTPDCVKLKYSSLTYLNQTVSGKPSVEALKLKREADKSGVM